MKLGIFRNGQICYRDIEDYKREVRLANGKIATEIVTVEQQFETLRQSGWKKVEQIDESLLENEQEFFSTLVTPIDKGETIGFAYKKRLDKRLVRNEIDRLKDTLASTDYKVIKCYEASLLDCDLPYDIDKVHRERQGVRDRINSLETIIVEQQ